MAGDLEAARFQLSRIVGRDTAGLDASEVSRATLETVAESTTDGVLAPLFWAAVGGPAAALLYRTANTLDSMVGHRDARYERFGKCSALADDVLSFVPARLCALLSLLTRGPQHAVAVVREAGLHASPNAGWSEAAAAWALRVRLGGTNHYDGIPQRGPVFNPGGTAPQANDVKRILLWFWTVTSVAGVAFTLLVHWRSTLERSRVPNHPVLPGVVETAPQQRIVRDRPFPPRRAVALPEVAGTQASFFW
jgi:adenosylcobinamide-phosphate synthase